MRHLRPGAPRVQGAEMEPDRRRKADPGHSLAGRQQRSPKRIRANMSRMGDGVAANVSTKVARALHDRRVGRAIRLAREADPSSAPFRDLHPHAVLLDGLRFGHARRAAINLVVPAASRDSIFAGLRTAFAAASQFAQVIGGPLRVLCLQPLTRADRRSLERLIVAGFGLAPHDLCVIDLAHLAGVDVGDADTWVATYWSTALCLDVLARRGRIDRAKVVYLVQDYEPMFYAPGAEQDLARETYGSGLRLLVNSSPLAAYIRLHDGVMISDEHVFCPELDWGRLAVVARTRRDPGPVVMYYHRPHHGRNMTPLANAALELASKEFRARTGSPLHVLAVGSPEPLELDGDAMVHNLGKLAWDDYFDRLGSARVMLSLQSTPHPSHPPLDMVVAGGRSVTNEVAGTRGRLHPRLHACEPTPEALAAGILTCITTSESDAVPGDSLRAHLGRELRDAVASLASLLG